MADRPLNPPPRASGRGLWFRVFLDILALTLLTVILDAAVVWKVYEDALSEQRTAAAGVVVSVLQGVVQSLPPEVAAVPSASRRRLAALLQPFDAEGLGLRSAVVFNEVGRPIFEVGEPSTVRSMEDDEDLTAALVNRMEIFSLAPVSGGPLFSDMLQITVPVRLRGGQRWALRVKMPLQEGEGVLSRLQLAALGILGINALLLGVVGYLVLSRRLVRPIEHLAEGVRGVSEGRLDLTLPVDRADEIGELSRSFNEMVSVLAAYRDRIEQQVSSLEAANAQLVATREQLILSEKLASVGRLAAGVAHEVGNPLAAITGYIELLLSDARDSEDRDMLTRVQKEVTRIDTIVRELLDVARSPSGQTHIVELAPLIEELVEFMGVEPRLAGVKVEVDIPRGAARARCIGQKVRQVLLNLIHNAADATGPGGRVVIHGRRINAAKVSQAIATGALFAPNPAPQAGSFIAVTVADDGPGIPRDLLGQVFEPFFTTKEPGEGTGLGLAVALKMVEGQGGFLTVASSDAGHGASISIYLPAAGGEA